MHSIRAGIGRTGIGASGTAMRLGTHSAAANDVHCRWVTMMMVIHQRMMLHLSTPILTTQVGKKKFKKKKNRNGCGCGPAAKDPGDNIATQIAT